MYNRDDIISIQNELLALRSEVELELRNVNGFEHLGVGLRKRNDQLTNEICFRAYVSTKFPSYDLPFGGKLPKEIKGVPIDVIQDRAAVFHTEDNKKYRPLIGGAKIINQNALDEKVDTSSAISTSSGTLGCFAERTSNNDIVMLTCAHVLSFGGSTTGDVVGQPSPPTEVCCCRCGFVGEIVDINNNGTTVEAGLVKLKSGILYENSILEIGSVRGSATAVLGERIRKRGKSTGLTVGTVSDIAYSTTVTFVDGGSSYTFTDQIKVDVQAPYTKFSANGDSGAVYINEQNRVVGLHMAGVGNDGVGNKIANVESVMGITILDAGSPGIIHNVGVATAAPQQVENMDDYVTAFENMLNKTDRGSEFIKNFAPVRDELLYLINQERESKVIWQRYQGPAFVANLALTLKKPAHQFPMEIGGIELTTAILKIADVLEKKGSSELSALISEYFMDIVEWADSPDRIRRFVDLLRNETNPVA